MNTELQDILNKLGEAKKTRGRLSMIAADSGLSYRTIYSVMHDNPPTVTARTLDKLTSYFKKQAARQAAEQARKAAQ